VSLLVINKITCLKFYLFTFLIYFSQATFATETTPKRLSKNSECVVKLFQGKTFRDVSSKKLYNLRIFSKKLKKNKKYSIFRFEKKTYVTLTKCLIPEELQDEIMEGEDLELLNSEDAEDNEKLNQFASRNDISRKLGLLQNNYFISFGAGNVLTNDKTPIFPYEKLSGEFEGDDWIFSKAEKSKYKTSTALNLGFGWKINPVQFFSLKFKHFKGSKDELISVQKNSDPPLEIKSKFDDSIFTFLIGQKFILLPDFFLRPVLSIHLGINSISSTQTLSAQGRGFDLNYNSTSLTALSEIGFEMMFSDQYGLHLLGGYQYLGKQNFRYQESSGDSSSDEGFKSGQNYSNLFVDAGLQIYF
jgi:hypothetical protein